MKHVLFLTAILISSALAAQPTLDQFLGAPIASGLAIGSKGKLLAWVENDKGRRNIFLRNAAGKITKLTNYNNDDGQELSDVNFSPDGLLLIYVRGGASNREGYSPNPASLASGVDQAIWCIKLADGTTYRVAAGSDPVFHPDGKKILFAKGPQIQSIGLEKGAKPSQLFFARGSNGSPIFSPDGKEVLFLSYRRDHNFVGVYNLAGASIRWISPEVSRDQFAIWSPDGKQIAFLRQPGLQADELGNFVGGVKFSICVADAVTGKSRLIWTSPADDGGFAQYYPTPVLNWTKTNRILFFSEHEGWNHVYSMNSDGSDLKDITPGIGEVESYVVNATGETIYFDGNRTDIDRRHIWSSGVLDGKPTAMTSGKGIEMYPALIDLDLFCFRSTANTPKGLFRYNDTNLTFQSISTQVWPKTPFVEPEQVIFKSADGTEIHGQLFIDRQIGGKRPGLVFMHGGPIRQMLLGFHYSDYYSNCYAFNQYLAAQGYAVIAVNYRDGIGYGRDFRRAKDQGPRGASEYQDVVAAAKYLQGLEVVDAGKIGLWGGSYGGYLTAMGLARNPEIFKSGVDMHGVHDWAFRARDFSPGGGWAITSKDMDLAYKNSPVADLSRWVAPVLLVCGDDDRNVLFQETTDLAEKLRARKVPVEILVLPDEVHGFLRYASWSQVFSSAKEFFDKTLKK